MNAINYGEIMRIATASLDGLVHGMVNVSNEFESNPREVIEDIEFYMKSVKENLHLLETLIRFYKEAK